MIQKQKTSSNDFRFVLYQGKNKIVEKSFHANDVNPVIRYSVDIREDIPYIIQRLQLVMSRRNLTYESHGYNFLDEYIDLTNFYGVDDKLAKPEYLRFNYGNKEIRGVECKFGLYINNNTIVERKFYVDNYNAASRFSVEIVELAYEICEEISLKLKELDVDHIWNDYILVNVYGLYMNQVRELSTSRRNNLIDNYNDNAYVKNIRNNYRSQSKQQ